VSGDRAFCFISRIPERSTITPQDQPKPDTRAARSKLSNSLKKTDASRPIVMRRLTSC